LLSSFQVSRFRSALKRPRRSSWKDGSKYWINSATKTAKLYQEILDNTKSAHQLRLYFDRLQPKS